MTALTRPAPLAGRRTDGVRWARRFFLLVLAAIALMLRAAWKGARDRAPGRDLRLLLFAMFVFTLVQLGSGDQLYGVTAVIFWFIGGQVLAYEYLRRRRESRRALAGVAGGAQ